MGRPTLEETFTTKEEYEEAWYAALRSSHGIALRAFPLQSVRARLMSIRTKLEDPTLFTLDIVQPSHVENELWIIKKR